MGLTRQAVRVYAAIDALKEKDGDDVLDALVPFLMPVIQVLRGTPFASNLLVAGVRKLYGWHITSTVADVFKERLFAKKFLRKEFRGGLQVYICDPPPEQALTDNEIAALTALDEIVDQLDEFKPRQESLFHKDKTRDELGDIIVKFLISLDSFSQDDMAAEIRRISRKSNESTDLSGLEPGVTISPEDSYLCALFVADLHRKRSPMVEHLSKIAAVGLLTEVVSDFVKPTSIAKKADVTVVLDTSLALDFLGSSGHLAKEEADQVAKALRPIGCQFIVFKKTCDEINRVLGRMLATPRDRRFGATHSAMLRGEVDEKFVKHIRDDPEGALAAVGIPVRSIDLTQFPAQHHYFGQELHDEFSSGLGWYSEDARSHDAECVTLVMRLRAGSQNRDPLSSKYIFTTSNPSFAHYAREFCLQRGLVQDRHCGPVVNYGDLATAAWLRTGLENGLAIPRTHLLAACERVMRVKREVVEKARATIKEVRPERIEQFELLLLDGRSVAKLMDVTLGSPHSIGDFEVDHLLNEMLRATTAQVVSEYDKKFENERRRNAATTQNLKESHQKSIAEMKDFLVETHQSLAIAQKQLAALQSDKEAEEARLKLEFVGIVESVNEHIERIGKALTGCLFFAGFFAVIYEIASRLGYLTSNSFMSAISAPASLLAIYYFIEEVRQKPKRGLDDLLNLLSRKNLESRCSRAGLSRYLAQMNLKIKGGQIVVEAKKTEDERLHVGTSTSDVVTDQSS